MANTKSDMAKLLRAAADFIELAPDIEVRAVTKDLARRAGRLKSAYSNPETKGARPRSQKDLSDLLNALDEAETREAGEHLLKAAELSRGELQRLASARSVHIVKQDNLSRVYEKIIEAVIGSRLNSKAIRGAPSGSQS